MQQKAKVILVVFVLLAISLLAINVFTRIQFKKETNEKVKKLPQFSFVGMNGKKFSRENIYNSNGIVIMNYFDPDCDHCQFMTKQIIKNITRLATVQIIMVSNSDSAAVVRFANNYQLASVKNIVVLRDPKSNFYKIWGSAVTPSFFIYNNKTMLKMFMGETKIENIIEAIK